jgi:TonB-dependent starch-binding outer membrane protein SusC
MKRKIAFLLCSLLLLQGYQPLFSQATPLSGKVSSSATQQPLEGATVQVKGTSTAVVTDRNGNFTIALPSAGATLEISYIGMGMMEVAAPASGPLNVFLTEAPGSLNEVVVIGYGQQRKRQVTGAISSVKAEELETVSSTRIEQALQGRTPGVQIVPTSGQPGAPLSVRIRGTGSNRNSSPLVIIDGVRAGGLESIDPSEVATIDILKDAASAAIYGAEGANGVIIITTKTGKRNVSQISYQGQLGIQSVKDNFITMMNAAQYQQYLQEAGVGGRPNTSDIAGIGEGTNWLRETIQTAPQQHHSLAFSGGSDKSTYLVSGNIFNQEGIVGGDKSRFQRYTARFNSDHQVKPWLNVGNRLVYSHHRRRAISDNNEFGSILGSALLMDPTTPVIYQPGNLPMHVQDAINAGRPLRVDANGNIYGISQFLKGEYGNPLARIDMARGENVQNKIVGSFFTEIMPFTGFKFTSRFGLDAAFQNGHGWTPTFWFSDESQNTIANGYDYNNNWFTWQLENFGTYQRRFGSHNFNLLGGVSAIKTRETHLGGSYSGLFREEDKFSYADFVPDDLDRIGSIAFTKTLASFYGRLSYDYDNTYLFSATLRRDGSSLFSPDYQWGTFPSVSAGWVFTNANFLAPLQRVFSFGKLRASWGQNGSLSSVGLGEWLNSVNANLIYPDGTGGLIVGAAPSSLAYPQLTWETSEQVNIGADFAFLDNKLNFTVDYFKKTTKDLLTGGNAPMFAGNFLRSVNAGSVENKGFELELGYQNKPLRPNGFTYALSLNYTSIQNNVTFLDPNSPILFGAGVGTGWAATAMQVGNPIWYFTGYRTSGIFQSQAEVDAYLSKTGITGYQPKPGEPIVVDVNGDKIISSADMTNIGSPHPDHLFGARLNLGYGGFDFLVFAQGQAGNEMLMGFNRADRSTANKPAFFYNNRWTGEGSTNTWFAANTSNPYIYNSDLMVFDGSFVRIRQLQIGYSLPERVSKRMKIAQARIYVSLDDFFTFTRYPGVDPEGGSNGGNSIGIDRGGYPIPRKAVAGISFTF